MGSVYLKSSGFLVGDRWKAISLAQAYPIATTFFLAEGNAGYLTLFDAIERVDTDLRIRDAFIDYARTVGTLENISTFLKNISKLLLHMDWKD
jgi:hypothetical protein